MTYILSNFQGVRIEEAPDTIDMSCKLEKCDSNLHIDTNVLTKPSCFNSWDCMYSVLKTWTWSIERAQSINTHEQYSNVDFFQSFTSALNIHEVIIRYTERQKKNHFCRSTLTKIHHIKINHILTQISYSSPYEAHLENQRVAFVKKEGKMRWNRKRSICFSRKSHKLLAENLHERPPYTVFKTSNSYSFNFKGEQFLSAILKITSCDFTLLYSFLIKQLFFVLFCFLFLFWVFHVLNKA